MRASSQCLVGNQVSNRDLEQERIARDVVWLAGTINLDM